MKVAVALCTYNGEKSIYEQLMSILHQTRAVDEVVVCDDASSDGTVGIIRDIASRSNVPIRLFVHRQNQGFLKNFEMAICRCAGDLIFLSDQDDIWQPQKVEVIVNYFLRHPEKNLVFTDAILINGAGAACYSQTLFGVVGMDARTRRLFDKGYAYEALSTSCRVTGATCALKPSLIPYCFPLTDKVVHDEALAIASAVQGKIGYINQCLIKYRQHYGQSVGLKMSMRHPPRRWELAKNIMMWHSSLVEPFDEMVRGKIRFVYRRFWSIRSPWAMFRLFGLWMQGEYKKYYPTPSAVLWWDLKARVIHLYGKLCAVRRIHMVSDDY